MGVGVRFGTFNLHAVPPSVSPYDVIEEHFEQMVEAENCGFDEVWLAEHNGRRYGMVGNVLVPAAALARATTRIRIATAVTRLPLHHPVHLAEDLNYIDVLSRGRLDFGVGKGYDKLEFESYGVPYDEREERWEEAFYQIQQMWNTGSTALNGQFHRTGDGELLPPPLQRPILPIYVMVSSSDSSVVWAAERLYPVALGSNPDWPDVRRKRQIYADTAAAAGHDDTAIKEALDRFWQLKHVHVSSTTQRAIDEYRDGLLWYFDALQNRAMFGFSHDIKPYEYYVEHGSVLLGSSEKVLNDLAAYRDNTGMRNVICFFNIGHQPHAQVMNCIRQFGAEVLPMLSDS